MKTSQTPSALQGRRGLAQSLWVNRLDGRWPSSTPSPPPAREPRARHQQSAPYLTLRTPEPVRLELAEPGRYGRLAVGVRPAPADDLVIERHGACVFGVI